MTRGGRTGSSQHDCYFSCPWHASPPTACSQQGQGASRCRLGSRTAGTRKKKDLLRFPRTAARHGVPGASGPASSASSAPGNVEPLNHIISSRGSLLSGHFGLLVQVRPCRGHRSRGGVEARRAARALRVRPHEAQASQRAKLGQRGPREVTAAQHLRSPRRAQHLSAVYEYTVYSVYGST